MRETRKAMLAKRGRSIAPPEVVELPPSPPLVESTLTQTRHIKCPCCGLQARVDPDPFQDLRRREPLPSISEGPYMPEARMVTWGGSKPKDMPGQRVLAKVTWAPPELCTPEEMEMLLRNLNGAISMISSISQEIEGGESEPRKRRSTRTGAKGAKKA